MIRLYSHKITITQKIFLDKPNTHVNQYLANLVINKQLPIQDKHNFRKYKKIYQTLKVWIFFKSKFNSFISQYLIPFIKPKITPIDNQK